MYKNIYRLNKILDCMDEIDFVMDNNKLKVTQAIEIPLTKMTGQKYNYLKTGATNIEQWTIRAEKYEGNVYSYYLQNPTGKREWNRTGKITSTLTVGKINNKWKIVGPY